MIVKGATGWALPASAQNDNRDAGTPFQAPENVTAKDGNYAISNANGALTTWLRVNLAQANFGASWPPAGATLTGMEFRATGNFSSPNGPPDPLGWAGLYSNGGRLGTEKNEAFGLAPTGNGDSAAYFGGHDDLWGTALTLADVGSVLQFEIRIDTANKGATVQIDAIETRLWYEYEDGQPGAGPGYDGSLTLVDSVAVTSRPMNQPFQPNPLRDTAINAAIYINAAPLETGEVEFLIGPDQASLMTVDYDASGSAGQDTIAKLSALVPAGWWAELRTTAAGTTTYETQAMAEYTLAADDVRSVNWTASRAIGTAPTSTSHKTPTSVITAVDVTAGRVTQRFIREPQE